MGMPRKGSRRIVVDGRAYLWRLRPPPDDPEIWMYPPPRTLSSVIHLQAADGASNRVCEVSVTWSEDVPVTPEAVAVMIHRVLENGWDPDRKEDRMRRYGSFDVRDLDTKANVVRQVMEA